MRKVPKNVIWKAENASCIFHGPFLRNFSVKIRFAFSINGTFAGFLRCCKVTISETLLLIYARKLLAYVLDF